jgi:hypothetical protein
VGGNRNRVTNNDCSNPEGEIMSMDLDENREPVRVPVMQRVMDNPFLLLFIGVVVPTVFYIIWGIMEIVTIPITN